MYARSTTVRGNPQALDEGIAYIRDEVMPMVEGMNGCVGLSMLCDRESGRCIVTTAWESEEAMRASAERVRDSRARAAEIFGDADPKVEEWEIAVMHRVHEGHDGARARVIWGQRSPDQIDASMDDFRMAMMPRMEELPGFCSVSLMINRATGRTATTVTYDSREAMMQANDRANAMREEFSRALGMEITDMAEFDLVLHHLRVPEIV